jgi:hypothetical protein
VGRQLAELKGSDTVTPDNFGASVAVSGTTAIVGAPAHANDAGRAYVFTETATGWKQVKELKGSDTVANDEFGYPVAISGTTALVGAFGHAQGAGRAYVFTKTTKGWTQAAELKASDPHPDDQFGGAVAISGTTVIVGAWNYTNYADQLFGGRAYIFTKSTSGWKQTAELAASDTVLADRFGWSVAISGTTAVVGAVGHVDSSGRAYVFTKSGTGWNETAELQASDVQAYDEFGRSVAVSGTTVLVGSWGTPYNEADRAYVFTKTTTGWKQVAELKGSDTVADSDFGYSVALSGATAAVGARSQAKAAGRAYVFTKTATGWKQTKELKGSDTVAGNDFGASVAVAGTTVLVGAPGFSKWSGRGYVLEG